MSMIKHGPKVCEGVDYSVEHSHAVVEVIGTPSRDFTYDANGSMTTRVIGTESYTLLYDGALRKAGVVTYLFGDD